MPDDEKPPATEAEKPKADEPVIDEPKIETDPTFDAAANNRAAYEARKARETADKLQKELDGYKRREEDARKEKLTAEQRIQEERDQLAAENERLKIERLQLRIAAEFKLPDALIPRLIGSDEDALRADAAELAKLLPKPRAGTTTDPSREGGMQPTFKRSQLRDPAFYRANEAAIKAAQAAGRISSD